MSKCQKPKKTAVAYVRSKIAKMKKGFIFSIDYLITPDYSRSAIQSAINCLIHEKIIIRACKGIYFKPTFSHLLEGKPIPPDLNVFIAFLCKRNAETIQLHGGWACNRLRLSKQVPLIKIFYTSGYSRKLRFINGTVKFIRTKDSRILQHAGTNVGLAISALYFLGRKLVDQQIINTIQEQLTENEYQQLKNCELPIWMKKSCDIYEVNKISGNNSWRST